MLRPMMAGGFVVVALAATPSALAETISCPLKDYPGREKWCFQNGADSVKGIVRARGSLDKKTSIVVVDVQLETDDLQFGPCGSAEVVLRDASGAELRRFVVQKVTIPGKNEKYLFVAVAKGQAAGKLPLSMG